MRPPRRFSLGLPLGVFVLSACFGDEPTGGGENPCASLEAYSVGTSVRDSLTSSDCRLIDGTFIDLYVFTVSGQQSLRLTLESTDFNAFLWLFAQTAAGTPPVAAADDISETNTNAAIHIVMAGGTFIVAANSPPPTQTGDYRLSSETVPDSATECAEIWVTPGITTAQSLQTTDCVDESGPLYWDEFRVVILRGQEVTITQTSEAFDAALRLMAIKVSGDSLVAEDDNSAGGTDARLTFSHDDPGLDIFLIQAAAAETAQTGAYTLDIQ